MNRCCSFNSSVSICNRCCRDCSICTLWIARSSLSMILASGTTSLTSIKPMMLPIYDRSGCCFGLLSGIEAKPDCDPAGTEIGAGTKAGGGKQKARTSLTSSNGTPSSYSRAGVSPSKRNRVSFLMSRKRFLPR